MHHRHPPSLVHAVECRTDSASQHDGIAAVRRWRSKRGNWFSQVPLTQVGVPLEAPGCEDASPALNPLTTSLSVDRRALHTAARIFDEINYACLGRDFDASRQTRMKQCRSEGTATSRDAASAPLVDQRPVELVRATPKPPLLMCDRQDTRALAYQVRDRRKRSGIERRRVQCAASSLSAR
jgi:hypothetical protein